jgi:DNA topoisomerase III
MEAQMKAICEGRSRRSDVVQQNLDQYRAVFNRTVQQMDVLKAVSQDFRDILSLPFV